jgi:hypothetical protein
VYQIVIIEICSIGIRVSNICNTAGGSLCRHLSIIPDHFL